MPVYDKEGLPRRPRLPRLGIIRLGVKETRNRNDGSEYTFPRATDHFVLTAADGCQSVIDTFGEKPTILDPVIIPGEDENIVASHQLRHYGTTWGLTCIGDGRSANRHVDLAKLNKTGELSPASHETKKAEWKTITCPCPLLESGDCRETMYLRFVLPTVPGLGVWQLSTGSRNSIANIQGTFALLRGLVGRITGIPLKLTLAPQEVVSDEGGRKTVRVLTLELSQPLTAVQMLEQAKMTPLAMLQAPIIEALRPEDEQPPEDTDTSDPVAPETEEAGYMTRQQLTDAEALESQASPPTSKPQPQQRRKPAEASKPAFGANGEASRQTPDPQEEPARSPHPYAAVLEEAWEHGLNEAAMLDTVIRLKSWKAFEDLGGTPDIAAKRLKDWIVRRGS